MLPTATIWYAVLLSSAVIGALALHFVVTARFRVIVGAETLFLGMAACTYHTTLMTSMRTASTDGMRYAFFMGTGILCFVLGTVAATLLARFDHGRELDAFIARPWFDDMHGVKRTYVLVIGVVAVAVTVAYFVNLGTFVPLGALRALLESGPAAMMSAYSELRASTRVGDYLGLGFVMQFKDVLLPLVAALFLIQYRLRSPQRSLRWVLFFLLVAIVGAAGTGARSALAMLGALFFLLGVAPYMVPARFSRLQNAAIGAVVVAFLSALTLMMGRRGQQTPFEGMLWAPYQVLERVCVGPSRERLIVFEGFLADQQPQLGEAAVESLRIVLPGRSDYTLSNQLHELLYGNPTGNVGLDVWGGLWYDWQWGGLLFAFALGILLHASYVILLRGRKSVVRVVSLTYAVFILGLATDLQVLLLRGFGTVVLFLLLSEAVCLVAIHKSLAGATADGRG